MEQEIEQGEGIVADAEDTNDEAAEETAEEQAEVKEPAKPKRTPQEEYDYHIGKAKRIAKKLGIEQGKTEAKPDVKSDSSKPNELDYGAKAFLKTYGIQGSDELSLVRAFQARTGDDLDTIVSDDIFLGKLTALRDARESANAIPKGKPRSGQTAVTDIDLAVAKYRETGELPKDFETRNKVVDAITADEKGPKFNF